jgi:hypothetical protein
VTGGAEGYEPERRLTNLKQVSFAEIGDELGRFDSRVVRWLRRAGVYVMESLAIAGMSWPLVHAGLAEDLSQFVRPDA